MKTKPIPAIITSLILLFSVTLITQCKQAANKDGIDSFLTLFGLQVQDGATKDLLKNFDMPNKRPAIVQLVNMLCNKTGAGKNSKPIFKLTVNVTDNELKDAGPDMTTATFSVKFSRDTLNIQDKTSTLSLKIKKTASNTFKIVDVDADQLLKDYIGFENLVRSKILTDADIYSPQTLAAFKVAEGLKAKYDSIPWFQHMGDKTYYFVVKGAMNFEAVFGYGGRRDSLAAATYKMGLLSPDQKEIIPVEYELIHNIGATFPNVIEVEKAHKRGFYNLMGQVILPAEYDQIFPLNDDADNLAVLRKGGDYYWWKKDYTISDKDAELKIGDILQRLPNYGKSLNLTEGVMKNVMEYNSREDHGSIYLPPSYLVDLSILSYQKNFTNPLRRNVEYMDASTKYQIKMTNANEGDGWLASAFYSIRDYFLGGRGEFYENSRVLVIDKKNNRVYSAEYNSDYSQEEGDGTVIENCTVSTIRAITDSLYEVKSGANLYTVLYNGKYITAGPKYHYMALKNDNLQELNTDRTFTFTKFIKMDDSYLKGCYKIDDETTLSKVNADMLHYMKNEIYADYNYNFKDTVWRKVFEENFYRDNKTKNDVVDAMLTDIDKYNLAFIEQKLKGLNNKKPPLELNKNKALAAQ